MAAKSAPTEVDAAFVARVRERLAAGDGVRRRLAPSGRMFIDRPLPLLLVHRGAGDEPNDESAMLVQASASFVSGPDGSHLSALIEGIAKALFEQFGGVLLLELWSERGTAAAVGSAPRPARFRVFAGRAFANGPVVRQLVRSLERVSLYQQPAEVFLDARDEIAPPRLSPLLTTARCAELGVVLIGLEVRPVARDGSTGEMLPIGRRKLLNKVGQALRRTAFEFSRRETRAQPGHFEAFGRRAFTKQAFEIDRAITAISQRFDLLMVTTPVNAAAAYEEFERTGFERAPRFLYRPRAIDPPILKRDLYAIPVERVTDPTLSFLFEEKRRELDLKLTLVEELHTRRFLPTSLALYGTLDSGLVAEARGLLDRVPAPDPGAAPEKIDAETLAKRAEDLLATLRADLPLMTSRVELRDDVSSLTVSNGNLLVGRSMTFAADRAWALLQHEVGTHVVTHWNGNDQPLSLLSAGLAGYDELQEGLAVFAEFLVGGLNSTRMRTLAGRVVAAHSMSVGRSFLETFHELVGDYGFSPRAAFTNTMRVHRGGGFVKDAVYLRGLRRVLEFVRRGGRIETLLIGKVATDHAPMIEELQAREILRPLVLVPSYLRDPVSRERIERVRQGLDLEQLVQSAR